MPDPVSISVAVVSLVTSATKAAKTCNTLCDKYKDAPFSLTSVHIECLTTKASLSMVDMLMKRNPSLMKSRLEADTPLAENIDVVLTGCCLTFALAEIEINKLTAIDKDSVIRSWKDKCRAVWQEDRMVMLLDRMRGIRDAVNLLLTVLQTQVHPVTQFCALVLTLVASHWAASTSCLRQAAQQSNRYEMTSTLSTHTDVRVQSIASGAAYSCLTTERPSSHSMTKLSMLKLIAESTTTCDVIRRHRLTEHPQ